mgnify:CR=1 FL=1
MLPSNADSDEEGLPLVAAVAAAAAVLLATAAMYAGVLMSKPNRQGWLTVLRSSIITLRNLTTLLDLSVGAKSTTQQHSMHCQADIMHWVVLHLEDSHHDARRSQSLL